MSTAKGKMTSNRNVLYRMYDSVGALLYVGATTNPESRFRTHAGTQPWWDEVTDIKVQRFDTWEELAEAEVSAIETEKPKYNLLHSKPSVWSWKPRAGRGGGTLYRRRDGVWIGRLELPPGPDGKRRQKTVSSKNRLEARRRFEAMKAEYL